MAVRRTAVVQLLKAMQKGVVNEESDPRSSFTEVLQREKIKKSRWVAICQINKSFKFYVSFMTD